VKLPEKPRHGLLNHPLEGNSVTYVDTGLYDLKTIENAAVNIKLIILIIL